MCTPAAVLRGYRNIICKKLSYSRDSAGQRSLRRSRSFKVTDFGTDRKPAVCDFRSSPVFSAYHLWRYSCAIYETTSTDRSSSVLFTCPICLMAQVSKQILCSTIPVLISPQRIIVLGKKHEILPNVPILYRVRRFQFNNQIIALNRIIDATQRHINADSNATSHRTCTVTFMGARRISIRNERDLYLIAAVALFSEKCWRPFLVVAVKNRH